MDPTWRKCFRCSDPPWLANFRFSHCSSSKIPCSPGLQWWELELSIEKFLRLPRLHSSEALRPLPNYIARSPRRQSRQWKVFDPMFFARHLEGCIGNWLEFGFVLEVWSLTTETTLPSAAVISDHSRWCCACRFACCAAMSWFRTSQLLYFWGPWGVSSWFCQLGSVDKCSPQSSCESIVWTQPKSAISSFACGIWVSADLHKAAGNQMQVFIWLMPLQTSKTYHKHKPRTKVEFYQFHQEHVMDNSGMLHPISCTSFVSPCGQLKHMLVHVSIWVSNWIRQFWMLWLSMDYWCWIFVFVPQLHCPRPV